MSVAPALRRYTQILVALLRREEESRRQAPFESLINMLEPIFFITMLSFLFYFLGRRQTSPMGGSPVLFYATGFFPIYFFIYVSRKMRRSVDAPHLRFPVEKRLDHIFVHIILRIIDQSILGLVLFGGLYLLFTDEAIPADFSRVVGACLAIVALGFCWGVLNLVVSRQSRVWGFFFPIVSRIQVLFSGVFFVPDFLPPDTRYVMSFNPMLHAIQMFKSGFYPNFPHVILDPRYLAYCSIVAVLLGLLVERTTRRSEVK
jgi:capsular polysaccharide transport system permease protein